MQANKRVISAGHRCCGVDRLTARGGGRSRWGGVAAACCTSLWKHRRLRPPGLLGVGLPQTVHGSEELLRALSVGQGQAHPVLREDLAPCGLCGLQLVTKPLRATNSASLLSLLCERQDGCGGFTRRLARWGHGAVVAVDAVCITHARRSVRAGTCRHGALSVTGGRRKGRREGQSSEYVSVGSVLINLNIPRCSGVGAAREEAARLPSEDRTGGREENKYGRSLA